MPNLNKKTEGEKFWNKNPCGGEWLSFKEKRDWLIETEPCIIDLLREDLLKDKEVLDVGCGQGLILSLIAEKAREVVGLDASQKSLKQAEKGIRELKLNNVELVKGDAENLPFQNDTFDTVYSIGVLHHTSNTQQGINEIHRVLKREGKAVIMLYRKFCPKGILVILLRFFSSIIDKIMGEKFYIANHLRKKSQKSHFSPQGTASLELFGCPILKSFSDREIKRMFNRFKTLSISHVQPGFQRLADFIPLNKDSHVRNYLKWLDKKTESIFGFYIVIEAEK